MRKVDVQPAPRIRMSTTDDGGVGVGVVSCVILSGVGRSGEGV